MKFLSTEYRKAMQGELRAAAKKTDWRQARGVVFRECDQWFIAGHWRNIGADPADGLLIEIMAKPMAIDPMLWEVMNLQENNDEPLSFRYFGAFICGTPVLASKTIYETVPTKAMPLMLETLDYLMPNILKRLTTEKFSDLAKNPSGIHDNWRMGETIIHALRLENEPELALSFAESHSGAFSNSKSMMSGAIAGKSHNELVVELLRASHKQSFIRRQFGRIFGPKT